MHRLGLLGMKGALCALMTHGWTGHESLSVPALQPGQPGPGMWCGGRVTGMGQHKRVASRMYTMAVGCGAAEHWVP